MLMQWQPGCNAECDQHKGTRQRGLQNAVAVPRMCIYGIYLPTTDRLQIESNFAPNWVNT